MLSLCFYIHQHEMHQKIMVWVILRKLTLNKISPNLEKPGWNFVYYYDLLFTSVSRMAWHGLHIFSANILFIKNVPQRFKIDHVIYLENCSQHLIAKMYINGLNFNSMFFSILKYLFCCWELLTLKYVAWSS